MERNYEEEAKAQGWSPQEEWRGDPEKWKDAKTFVEVGENILPIVKSKLDRVVTELEEVKSTNKQFGEFFQDFKKREEKEQGKLRAELEALKIQAVTDGDGEAFMKAERELAELNQPAPQQMTPVQKGWLAENSWYSTDQVKTAFANDLADRLVLEGYTDQSPAFFKEITRQVKEQFSDDFGNKNRSRPQGVESDVQLAVPSKERSYENLPKEAKDACDRFVKEIPGFKKEDYVKAYEWESE